MFDPKYVFLFIAFLIFCLAIFLLWFSRRKWEQSGLPRGRLIYADPGLWGRTEKPFYDCDLGLTGKPDFVVNQKGRLLPVEAKSMWAPSEPYDSHILQLGAYCYLIEKTTGKRPPYGILKYRNRSFAIDYNKALEQSVIQMVDEIRHKKNSREVNRSHEEARRCARCGFRKNCDQRL
jgi:CRISPR-associated exonuclease Cas4